MATALEDERLLLEELEAIDWAITQRIKRVPQIHPNVPQARNHGILGNAKKSPGQVLSLQHEVARLLSRHDDIVNLLSTYVAVEPTVTTGTNVRSELSDPNFTFDKFDSLYKEIMVKSNKRLVQGVNNFDSSDQDSVLKMYEMFGSDEYSTKDGIEEHTSSKSASNNNKRRKVVKRKKRIFSSFAKDLRLSSIFTKFENMGKFLDLDDLFKQWLSLPKMDANLSFEDLPTYLEFVSLFYEFDRQSKYIKRDNLDYLRYLQALFLYLSQFWIKIQPLGKPQVSLHRIRQESERKVEKKLKQQDQDKVTTTEVASKGSTEAPMDVVEEDGSVFCIVCEKKFAKETVYKAHLPGKKHIKNLQKKQNETQSITNIANNDNNDGDNSSLNRPIAILEDEIYELSKLLATQITNTKNEIERRKLLTQRERLLEQQDELDISENEYDFESDGSEGDNGKEEDGEDDDDETGEIYNPLKLPMGPDGKPMPYWLWKIQGLGSEFKCEICGGHIYQGRKKFESHFNNDRHLHGLRCLGIESDKFHIFKDISNINDAVSLWDVLKRQNREELKFKDSSVEIEDEDGNVMSEKIYNQLKKQGIL